MGRMACLYYDMCDKTIKNTKSGSVLYNVNINHTKRACGKGICFITNNSSYFSNPSTVTDLPSFARTFQYRDFLSCTVYIIQPDIIYTNTKLALFGGIAITIKNNYVISYVCTNKGNTKITELRTTLQRESQNS